MDSAEDDDWGESGGSDTGFGDDGTSGNDHGEGDGSGDDGQNADGNDDGGTETGGDETCSTNVNILLPVQSARVVSPMEKLESSMGEGIYARSLAENQGLVEFSFELPCSDEFTIWGRVNDFFPGPHEADPDSFFVRIDRGSTYTWFYGCQTTGSQQQWNWLAVHSGLEGVSCDEVERMSVELDAGLHTMRFRNREGTNYFGEFAAVARLIITNDPTFIPDVED